MARDIEFKVQKIVEERNLDEEKSKVTMVAKAINVEQNVILKISEHNLNDIEAIVGVGREGDNFIFSLGSKKKQTTIIGIAEVSPTKNPTENVPEEEPPKKTQKKKASEKTTDDTHPDTA